MDIIVLHVMLVAIRISPLIYQWRLQYLPLLYQFQVINVLHFSYYLSSWPCDVMECTYSLYILSPQMQLGRYVINFSLTSLLMVLLLRDLSYVLGDVRNGKTVQMMSHLPQSSYFLQPFA